MTYRSSHETDHAKSNSFRCMPMDLQAFVAARALATSRLAPGSKLGGLVSATNGWAVQEITKFNVCMYMLLLHEEVEELRASMAGEEDPNSYLFNTREA